MGLGSLTGVKGMVVVILTNFLALVMNHGLGGVGSGEQRRGGAAYIV